MYSASNWPNMQISQCTYSISHNASFRTEMCIFLFWMVHFEIWNRCIVGFVRLVYWACHLAACNYPGTLSYNQHYSDVIISVMASQITGVSIVYSTVCSGADQRKHQSSKSLACVRGIHRSPVSSPHKGPVTRKMFPFDDVIMKSLIHL